MGVSTVNVACAKRPGRFARTDDQGAAAIEFALVLIVLVMFLTGIIQFGYTFFQYLEISHAAREGARWAALGFATGDVTQPVTVRGRTSAAALGLSPALTDSQITVTAAGAAGLQTVTVRVNYVSPVFMPLLGEAFTDTEIPLQSSATLRVE